MKPRIKKLSTGIYCLQDHKGNVAVYNETEFTTIMNKHNNWWNVITRKYFPI